MPELDPLLLSRIQFAFTISFHILFPSFTVGLAAWLFVLEILWLKTGKAIYFDIARHWTKIFAVSFGMGVVSGVVLSYEFGTNWSELSRRGGNVIGPLMSYEVLTAFFLEAGFLGIMLFGQNRVPKAVHVFATAMVALGTAISAFWILSANSWMQTPAGYTVATDGVPACRGLVAVIFNPSFPYRFAHMVIAAYLTTAFIVGGIGAWYILRERCVAHGRIMLVMALSLLRMARAAAGRHRRSAWAQYPEIPAGQGRRARSALGDRERGAADPVRSARPKGRNQPLPARDPQARQPDPHP